MSAQLKVLYDELAGKIAADKEKSRFNRQRMIEDEIFHHRPDYNEAMEMLDSLEAALNARYNDNCGPNLDHYFKKLREALDEADDLECRRTYDPRDQYAGPEDDFPYQPK